MNRMKVKRIMFIIALLFMLVLSTTRVNIPVVWASPRIYVDPPTVKKLPGETFTIDIKIEGVTAPNGVAGWELMIKFDFSILYTEAANITEGTFLSSQGFTFFSKSQKPAQSGWLLGCTFMAPGEATGSGTLATIEFEVVGKGETPLELSNTDLREDDMTPIPHTADDGLFMTPFPKASFTYNYTGWPDYPATVGRVITFNASDSYDPDGDIVSYTWDFDDGTPPITVENKTGTQYWLINHTYTSPGSYSVNLTVTDNDGYAGSAVKSVNVEFYDMVITDIEVNPTIINPGKEPFPKIEITVFNNGSVGESFNLTLYYDNNPIWYNKTIGWEAYMRYKFDENGAPRDPLMPDQSDTVLFTWNTTGVAEGTYTIWANVSRMHASGGYYLPGENDTADNFYNYGDVLVTLGAPIADFTFTPPHPMVNEIVTFNASASYDPDGWLVSYTWDFDDGTPPITVENKTGTQYWLINHTYTSVGTYTVILNITDNDGNCSTRKRDLEVDIHDLAITSVSFQPTTVYIGKTVTVTVTVKSEGGFDETFSVIAYYDGNTIDTYSNVVVKAGKAKDVDFIWNTAGFPMHTYNYTYTIKAEVSVVKNETNTDNNVKTATEKATMVTRNIAITDITVSTTAPKVGDSLIINVTVTNEGSYIETFNVTAYYDENIIGNYTDITLTNGNDRTLTFTWNTAGIALGTYTIKANATEVGDEINKTDNTRIYGNITLEKLSSTISITVSSTNVTLGESVTITGSITPTRAGATVTIWFKLQGEETWNTATVQTNDNGEYSYSWEPQESGTYEVYTSWAGDATTQGDESEIKTVNVEEAAQGAVPSSILYAVAGTIIVIAAATLIYFAKFRKPT